MTNKKISVIIPVYNMEKYLEECLDSIVNQTVDDLEVIAVNDGSTDNSLEILERYRHKYPNFIVYSQENQGQACAKNYGILHASGKYIIFMDPDDYYPDYECLKKIYDCAEKHNALICAGIILFKSDMEITVNNLDQIEKYYRDEFVDVQDYDSIYNHQRYLFDKEFIVSNNIRFPLYRRYEDPPFTVKALALAQKFYASTIPVYVHRVGHKKMKYSMNVCEDVVRGVRDAIDLCYQYSLDKMYEKCLKNITEPYIIPFYKYSYVGNMAVDGVIKEFNDIMIAWEGKDYQPLTQEWVCNFKKRSLDHYSFIMDVMMSGQPVILYGAGKRADTFLDIYNENQENILGFAVSNTPKEDQHRGVKVQNIDQYDTEKLRENAYVIISVSSVFRKEIEEILNNKGFRNVVYPEMTMLILADSIINDSLR